MQYLAFGAGILVLVGCGEDVVDQSEGEPDPVVVDIPIAFIKRNLAVDENGQLPQVDLRAPTDFTPGASLYLKARASVSAEEINITDRLFLSEEVESEEQNPAPQYDVKDLEVSYDGTRLLFALRAPELEDADENQQPTWNIWEYDILSDSLRRIISSDLVAEAGQDTGPVYLADGRILFSSTRQRGNQAILLDEGKPQYSALEESLNEQASVLHLMDSDGANITQVSFNQSHDLDPVVLNNGKVMFSRWDQASGDKGIHLYQMNPDGSELEILYGRHSHQQNEQELHFVQGREVADERILVAIREYQNSRLGGDYVLIDVANYTDLDTPIIASLGGQAQEAALFENIDTQNTLSPGGYFAAVYPLWDGSGRQLFSWSQCRAYDPDQEIVAEQVRRILPCDQDLLNREDVEPAPLLYGLWMYDPADNTQLVIAPPEEGIAYTEVVSMESRPFPADFAGSDGFEAELAQQDLGILHIRSVYDFAGVDTTEVGLDTLANPSLTTADERPVRFLRVVKSVSIPDEDTLEFNRDAFGRDRSQLMREIIGYVPVEPDGSAKLQVPANVPLALSLLDVNGKRVSQRHENWLQVAPGEVKTCNGCHNADSTAAHGRLDAEQASINLGAAATGQGFVGANPELFADIGETMAETATRLNGVPYPQADIEFVDIWTDPATAAPSESFNYAYADMQSAIPVSQSCAQTWTSLCRVVINYPEHIQPIFAVDRSVTDELGNLLSDQTCISCHSPLDADGLAQVPAAQLDLSEQVSVDNPDHLTGYRELMFRDNEQELVDGVLLDRLEIVTDEFGNIVFETDENGDLILDGEGNPIPVTRTIPVANSASPNGALASAPFFEVFEVGSHQGWLSSAELKLMAEWLDLGAQYYNNPFDVPQD